MNFKKIQNYIYNILKIKKKKKRKTSIIFNNTTTRIPFKKRNNFCLKNKHLQYCKILGNNIKNYYTALIVIILFGILYLVIGPIFKIQNIDIIKKDNITNMDIAYKAMDNYRFKSILNIERKEILEDLKKYQNNIKDISIDIILPDTLKIIIDSHKAVFNTTINNKTFFITENGVLIPSTYSKELKELNIKYSFNKNNFIDYKKILNTEYIFKIYLAVTELEKNILNTKVTNIFYYLTEREVHIQINEKTLILIDLSGNIKEQIEKLAIFNKEQSDINRGELLYIDLRIRNKIFICNYENEYQCNLNIKTIYSKE